MKIYMDTITVLFENSEFSRLVRLLEAITDPDLEFDETHILDAERLLSGALRALLVTGRAEQMVDDDDDDADMEAEAEIDWDNTPRGDYEPIECEFKTNWDTYSVGECPLDQPPTGTYPISPDEILFDPISNPHNN